IKIKAGQSAKITLKFQEPKKGDAKVWPLYSGYVVATPKSKGGIPVNVPYVGVKGDVRHVPILDTDTPYVGLYAETATGDINDLPADKTFDLTSAKNDIPVVVARLGSHSPNFSVRVFDDKNKFVGNIVSTEEGLVNFKIGRNANINDDTGGPEYRTFSWYGQIATPETAAKPTTIPSGTYRIEIAAQKKFSKGAYPVDFEVVDFGSITVKTA
ncbi:hypothetical protein BGZ76_005030, partial [Entomortierella beljakovae]